MRFSTAAGQFRGARRAYLSTLPARTQHWASAFPVGMARAIRGRGGLGGCLSQVTVAAKKPHGPMEIRRGHRPRTA